MGNEPEAVAGLMELLRSGEDSLSCSRPQGQGWLSRQALASFDGSSKLLTGAQCAVVH